MNVLCVVINQQEEEAGWCYDGSLPIVINGEEYRPFPKGLYFEVAGKVYQIGSNFSEKPL